MASPFSIFRKHKMAMMVILVIVAMGGFVVLPTVLDMMDDRGQRANPVVVSTTKYGDINEQELQWLQQGRVTVFAFLQRVGQGVVMAGGTGRAVRAVEQAFGPITEEAIVDTWLLARRAEDLGMVVTDDTVNRFLAELLENKGASIDIADILNAMQLSDVRLFELLRQELLALRLKEVLDISMAGVTPAERWDYYQRLNRKIAIETIAIPIERFVTQVEDPEEETLRQFFENHKDEEYNPTLPDPGFRVPKKIAVQYFKIDLASIPASEVEAYYEENKEAQFKPLAFTLGDEEEPRPGLGSVPGLDDGRESLPGLFENGRYATPLEPKTEPLPEGLRFPTDEPAQPGPPEKPTEERAQPAETGKPAGNAAEESPKKQETPAEPAGDDKKTPESDDGAAARPISPFVLASSRQEKADEKNAATPPPTEEEKTPADTPPTGAEMGATPEKGAQPAPEESADKPIDEVVDSILGEKASEEEETEYRPLTEVEDEIRRTLAEEKFQKLAGLQERMTTYRNAKLRYDVDILDTEKGSAPKPPEELDFPTLAKENGLSAHETGLVSMHEAALLDIGKSAVPGGSSFMNAAFKTLPEYRPTRMQDDEGNEYLFWKTQETEGREPEFEDEGIRAEVLHAWKIGEARENVGRLAAILADELGKKLQRSPGQSLATMSDADFQNASNEAFKRAAEQGVFPNLPEAGRPDLHVIETEPFSWMTYGSLSDWRQAFMYQVPPWLGEIKTKIDETEETSAGQDAVAMPGDDFMRAVYALEPGAIGVAMNRPMTAAYVVRVAESNPSKEVLWGTFLVDMKLYGAAYNSLMAGNERREIAEAWRKEIEKAAGFKWER